MMGQVLCAAAITLLFVMFVGHGLWVAVAWLFRSIADEPRADLGTPCSQCGAGHGVKLGRCTVCGAVPEIAPRAPRLRDDLQTTIHHLQRLAKNGAISQQQCDDLVTLFQAELTQLVPGGSRQNVEQASRLFRPSETLAPHEAPGPGLVPAAASAEVVDAILVEPPIQAAPAAAPPVAQQPVHPLDRPYVPPPPAPPSQPARAWADVLQSFMEESNIRWGEILAATLIVLCSVGLVISLRNTLRNIPYFPAILFTLFTVSFHGAGLYTLRRWKLQAVSRVILIISLLLVPLTFCGAIILQQARPVTDPLFLVALVMGTGILTWVCYSASRELVGGAAWPLTLGVLGPSLAQVIIQRLDFSATSLVSLNAAAAIPIGSFFIATGWQIWRARAWPQLSQTRVVQIVRVLGIAAFALLPPLALMLVHSQRPAFIAAHLSPLLSLAAAAALALGLIIHRRTTAKGLAAWQTVGTAILVLSSVLLALLVAAAWPDPEILLVLGLMNCVILVLLGIVAELPLLYVPSVACAALAVTIGWHLLGGHFGDRVNLSLKVVQAVLRGQTSIALGMLGTVVGAFGGWLLARKKAEDALMLLLSCAGLAAIALGITLFSGFVRVPDWPQDRDLAAAILLVYAAALIALGPISRRIEVTGCGSLILWLALIQALVFNDTFRGWLGGMHWLPDRPVLVATLAHGVLTALAALASGWLDLNEVLTRRTGVLLHEIPATQTRQRLLTEPLAIGAAISLAATTPFIIWVQGDHFSSAAIMALWAALGWAALALSQHWPWAVSALQAMLALAPALAVAGIWKERIGGPNWFVNEQHLFGQLIAAALTTLVWSPARRLTTQSEPARRLLCAPWPAVDQLLLGGAALSLPLVTILLVLPDIGWELNFEPYMRSPSLASAGELPVALNFGWIALAVVLVALTVSLWERVSVAATVGLGIATFAAVSLAAGHFQPSAAVSSASRWTAAMFTLLWGAAFIARNPLRTTFKRLPQLRWERFPRWAGIWLCAQPLLLGGRAILLLTIIAVYQHASGVALNGPAANSLFAAMGPTVSYAAPLMALVVVLLGYAVRERQSGFALGGAAVSQLAVNLAWLLHVTSSQPADLQTIEWLQWNSVAAGAFALIWLGLSRWIVSSTADDAQKRLADALWFIPVVVAGITAAALIGWTVSAIFVSPALPAAVLTPLGSWLSYLAVLLVLAAALWRAAGRLEIPGLGDAVLWLIGGLIPLIAASVNRFDSGGQWLAYHSLEAGWLAVGAIGCGLIAWSRRSQSSALSHFTPHHLFVAVITAFIVVLAVRGNPYPAHPLWSVGGALGACVIIATLGLVRRSQPYAFVSTALAGLAMILFWNAPATAPWTGLVFGSGDVGFAAAIDCLFCALIAASSFWLAREIASQMRLNQSLDVRPAMPRVHAAIALSVLPIDFLFRLVLDGVGVWLVKSPGSSAASVVTTLAFAALLAGMLWDRRATFLLPLAYLWSALAWLIGVGLIARWLPNAFEPTLHYNIEFHIVLIALCAALQVAITGQIWSYGANLAAIGERMGVADPIAGLARAERWLIPLNCLAALGVCLVDLTFVVTIRELPLRVAAAWGPAIVAWGLLCLAQGQRRDTMQLASLLVAGLSAVDLAWAQIDPHEPDVWMTRTFRLLMVLAALTFAYGLVLPRFLLTSGSWNAATRKAGHIAGVAALATFVVTLVLETAMFKPGIGNGVADVQVAAIAVVLVALIAGLISLALLPGRDPLVLSERGRQAYVYAAEVTAALLFAHLYVCKPLWFDGLLRPYWPFIVMGLAFGGVGAAETFERFRVRVLAEPLARTGAMLPLLPMLGMWVVGAEADYALVLLVAGILYVALSYTRKSWAAMLAATVAGNGALWTLLDHSHFAFAANPQLWLIPPALSVLAAAQLNRSRLAPEMLTAIRYAATIVIYVSSTSEIFARGFDAGLMPPMVLLGLAVAGTLVGIALRVQAFLFLGSAFTLVALIAMVRHAAQSIDHVWPWWVFGIALGVTILVLFGIFEKKHTEVMLFIGRLQKWER